MAVDQLSGCEAFEKLTSLLGCQRVRAKKEDLRCERIVPIDKR